MRLIALAGLAFAVAAPALAASPFDGTWKADVKSAQLPKRPDVILVKDGMYACSSCKPAFSVKADGAFHKITGQPYFDEAMVKIVDAGTLMETDKLKGKIVYTTATKIAADGKTQTLNWTDSSAPDGKTTKGETRQKRVVPAPAGAHAASGQWQTTSFGDISDASLTVTFKVSGDTFTMSTPNGFGYVAKFGGPAVPIIGDPSGMTAAVKKIDAMTVVETDARKNDVRTVLTMTALPGGKAIKVSQLNKATGATTVYMMARQ